MKQANPDSRRSQFETVLRQRGAQLRREIRAGLLRLDTERHALLAERVHDTKDQAMLELLADTGAADIARDAQELADVGLALERLDNGRYGSCTACGAVIPAQRLAAYPTAKRCLPCQERHEQQRRG